MACQLMDGTEMTNFVTLSNVVEVVNQLMDRKLYGWMGQWNAIVSSG